MFGSWADKTILILLVVAGFDVLASLAVAGASYIYIREYGSYTYTERYSWWWVWTCAPECDVYATVRYIDSPWGRTAIAGGVLSIGVVLMFCCLVLVLMFMQAAISQLRQGTTCLPGARFGKQFLSSRLSLPKGSHPKVLIFSMPVIWVSQLVLLILMAVLYHTDSYRRHSLKSEGAKYDAGFIVLMISFLVNTAVYLLLVCSPSEYIPANADEPNASSGVGMIPPPQPVEQVRAQPATQQQQPVAAEGSPYGAAGGGAQSQPPVAAWGPQPPYPPFRESSGSAVWALFLLVPALLLMVCALGQDVFADTVNRWEIEYSPPRVMLWNVENCTFKNASRIHCTDVSFDDAKSLISSSCVGYAIGTAVTVVLSVVSVSLCIVLGIQEVRGKEPFPYACAAATVVGLLFTGLSWGLPLGALDRNVCTYTYISPLSTSQRKYSVGGVTRVSIAAFCLLWGVLAGYIPRICRWGCCSRRADEEEGEDAGPAEEGGNAVTAVTGSNFGTGAGREEKMATYSSVAILVWCLLCLSLSIAVLATPLLHANPMKERKLYLWNAEDCYNTRCTTHSIESVTSGLCVAHIGSAAFFIILGTISVMCAIPLQIQELRGRPVFRFAPIAAALFAATSFGAAFGLVTTARARYYCSPYSRYSSGFELLVSTMCLLLLTPVFRVGKVMCSYCYEYPAHMQQHNEGEEAVAAEGSPYSAAGGGAQSQPPAAAWGPQPPYPPPFRESSGSAVWALFLLVPALLLMRAALGQDVFTVEGLARAAVYSPPRVMLWNVEKCVYKGQSRIHCTDMSFDEAKSKAFLSSSCVGYAIGTAAMVVLSGLWIPICIVLGIQEVRGKEPFPYACAAATVVGLLFTGLSWGLPVAALDRRLCRYTAEGDTHLTKYSIGGVTRVSIAAFCLLWGVLAGYIPRICRWGCCSRRADEEEGEDAGPAEEGDNALTAVTGSNVGADSGREERMATYSSVAILVWCLLCLSLSVAVLATPLLHADSSKNKLYLWNANDCSNSPCTSHSIESATSGLCVAHIGSAAFFMILGTIAVMCTIPLQIQELRGRPVFRLAPIAAALFAATSFGAAFGLVTTAKARYYCSPYTTYTTGFVLLVTTMGLLLLTPVFRLGKLFPMACCCCYANAVHRGDVPPAPAAGGMTAGNPQGSVPAGATEPISSEEYSMREEGRV